MNPFLQVIETLNQNHVRYVVVGGFAALLHGNSRLTADLDLAVDLSPAEASRTIEVLVEFGLRSRLPVDLLQFADAIARTRWQTEKNMTVFSLFDPKKPTLVVDLFVSEPIRFGELWSRAEEVRAQGVSVRVAAIRDLIAMKEISARPQDLLDIQNLRAILAARGGQS